MRGYHGRNAFISYWFSLRRNRMSNEIEKQNLSRSVTHVIRVIFVLEQPTTLSLSVSMLWCAYGEIIFNRAKRREGIYVRLNRED